MPDKPSSDASWWQTLPGILTGVAAIITAVTGLVMTFNHFGERLGDAEPPPQSIPSARRSLKLVVRHTTPATEVTLQISAGDDKARIPLMLP